MDEWDEAPEAGSVGDKDEVSAASLGLYPAFEAIVAYYAATEPRFWRSVGMHISPSAVSDEACKLVLQACQDIQESCSTGPSGGVHVLQRVFSGIKSGKLERETALDVKAYLISAKNYAKSMPWDIVMAELLPFLRAQLTLENLASAGGHFRRTGDLLSVINRLVQIEKLGSSHVQEAEFLELGPDTFDLLSTSVFRERISTGILELDTALNGGPPRGSLTVFAGDTGGGKSMALNHVGATAYKCGKCVLHVTLELPKDVQLGRTIGNLTGVKVNAILSSEDGADLKAKARFDSMVTSAVGGFLGRFYIADRPPNITHVRDLSQLIDTIEKKCECTIEVLVVDYADKMSDPAAEEKHVVQGLVYEALRRDIAQTRDIWVYTASQSTRPKDNKRLIDVKDTADSMEKPRVSDIWVTINLLNQDDTSEVTLFLAKHRYGMARFKLPLVYTDFSTARFYTGNAEYSDQAEIDDLFLEG